MHVKRCLLGLALYLPMSVALAQDRECVPPPCDPKTDSRAKCEAAADWVIEGELGSVIEEHGPSCRECSPAFRWSGATLVLYKAKGIKLPPDLIFKGAITTDQFGGVRIGSSSWCWEKISRIDHLAIDKVVRLYGTGKQGTYPLQIKPGYFAYEVIGERPDQTK